LETKWIDGTQSGLPGFQDGDLETDDYIMAIKNFSSDYYLGDRDFRFIAINYLNLWEENFICENENVDSYGKVINLEGVPCIPTGTTTTATTTTITSNTTTIDTSNTTATATDRTLVRRNPGSSGNEAVCDYGRDLVGSLGAIFVAIILFFL